MGCQKLWRCSRRIWSYTCHLDTLGLSQREEIFPDSGSWPILVIKIKWWFSCSHRLMWFKSTNKLWIDYSLRLWKIIWNWSTRKPNIPYANSTGPDQTAHTHSLARAFAVRTHNIWSYTNWNWEPVQVNGFIGQPGRAWGTIRRRLKVRFLVYRIKMFPFLLLRFSIRSLVCATSLWISCLHYYTMTDKINYFDE